MPIITTTTYPITKPTEGATSGWNDMTDAAIEVANHTVAPTVTLTDASTVAIDAADGRTHKVVVAGNRTIGKPSDAYDGQTLVLTIIQDGTGSRAWTLHADYRVPAGITITPTATPGAKDRLIVAFDSADSKFDVLAYLPASGVTASAANPWEFRPEDFGAVGDNSTNDQDAINDCIDAAVTWATTDGNYYAEIVFSPGKTYVVSGATIKGGDGQGNAQLPLPAVVTTGRKLTLVLKGGKGSDSFAHWEQTVGQVANATVRTTLTGLSADGTWGAPSVFGTPTAGTYAAGNAFSNLRMVVDGVNVVAPFDPGIIAFDFQKAAQTKIINAGAFANAGPDGSPDLQTIPTNDLGVGLRASRNTNNAVCDVDTFACEGFYYGAMMGEHFTALRFLAVYCHTGLYISCSGGQYHGGSIVYACIEQCVDAIEADGGSSGTFPLTIGLLDTEIIDNVIINDTLDALTGVAYWADTSAVSDMVSGAKNYKLISNMRADAPGAKTAPTVPATTVDLVNPFYRDCAVSVTGGTVTAIEVDDVATGLTAGTVIVPSGKKISLTYSSAPTWTWVAL